MRPKLDRAKASYTGKRQYDYPNRRIIAGTPEQLEELHNWKLGYSFRVGFYNEKDVDTGLMDIEGAIIGPDGRDFIPLRGAVRGANKTINLPAHGWTYFSLEANEAVGEDRIDYAKKCNRVQIRARWPNGRPYKSGLLEFEIKTYFPGDPPYLDQE